MARAADSWGTILAEMAALTSLALAGSAWLVRPMSVAGPVAGESPSPVVEPLQPPVTDGYWDDATGTLFLAKADDRELMARLPDTGLRTLFVDDGHLSDQVLRRLLRYPELEHVRLRRVAVTDAGAESLSKLPQLRIVNIPHAVITDEGLKLLATLPRLEMLRFGSPNVTDRGLQALAEAPGLRFLHIIDTPISDKGVRRLVECRRLESLYLDGVSLSDETVEFLLSGLPNLHLHLDQKHHDRDPRRAHPEMADPLR